MVRFPLFNLLLVTLLATLFVAPPRDVGADDGAIAHLLAGRCLECHSGAAPQAGLDLSHRKGLKQGGDSGEVLDGNAWEESRIWQAIASGSMPPKAKLTDDEKERLRQWIADGASLPEAPIDRFQFSSSYRAGYDWWSWQPLSISPPAVEDPHGWSRDTIDAWVLQALQQQGLAPNPPAEPRALVRRLYFDLIGLPPAHEDVERFAQDPSDAAYAAIVDRLLSAPQFGERWARHWMDVVRFGESDGFERNFPRLNSWHYRDWLIRALNQDLPYDEFIRLQIAGDVFDATAERGPTAEGLSAVGFLVAGVHNTVVGSSERMKRIARQDELEEKVATLSQAFLGMTAQCARCHDHKYDPITSESYYQLTAALQGADHGEREWIDPHVQQQERALEQRREELQSKAVGLDRRALAQQHPAGTDRDEHLPIPLVAWDFTRPTGEVPQRLGTEFHGQRHEDPRGLVLDGHSYLSTAPLPFDLTEKTLAVWVSPDSLDQSGGGVMSVQSLDGTVFDAIVYGEREPGRWMAGSNGFARSQSFGGPEETLATGVAPGEPIHFAIRYSADGTIEAFRNGLPYGKPYITSVQSFVKGGSQILIGLRHSPPGGNRFFRGIVHSAACFETSLKEEAIAALARDAKPRWDLERAWAQMPESERQVREQVRAALHATNDALKSMRERARHKIYTVISHPSPGKTHLLIRGDVFQEGDEVHPGGIRGLGTAPGDFGLDASTPDRERRRALAEWIVSVNQPLLARVLVNRLWHYHFGTGIVDTPNDFGFNGGRPTHSELLDQLAAEFLRGGLRMKELHRRIVLSSTYRSSTTPNPQALTVDANNRLLWRYPVRRLDGEAVRDAMLHISGVLRNETGGAGYVDVDITENNGTTYYLPKASEDDACFRRTVYRFNPRCERSALLDVLDCPDPSATAPRRANTTTPLQALSLLNNAFVFQMAQSLTERLGTDIEATEELGGIEPMFRAVLQRDPTHEELTMAESLVRKHGLRALARAMWNSNEFLILE